MSRKVCTATILVFVALAVASCSCSQGGSLRPQDATATREYVDARYALSTAIVHDFFRSQAAVRTFVSDARANCPGIMIGVPHGSAFGELDFEALTLPLSVIDQTDRVATRDFAKLVGRLNWSDGRLTALVHQLASKEITTADITSLDLCRELRRWVAGTHVVAPPASRRYLHKMRTAISLGAKINVANVPPRIKALPIYESTGRTMWQMITRFADRDTKSKAAKTQELESRIEVSLGTLYASASRQLSRDLGLDPAVLRIFLAL